MAVNISLKQAIFLFLDAQHLKKKGRKLVAKYESNIAGNFDGLKSYKKGLALLEEGQTYELLAKSAFRQKFYRS